MRIYKDGSWREIVTNPNGRCKYTKSCNVAVQKICVFVDTTVLFFDPRLRGVCTTHAKDPIYAVVGEL